ncbi:MAG: hypothetical protein EHM44_06250 [Ignavibacteriales bacterium]|jgi:hypothetical protein|nr:MAG: hypothetical protein EHM44_06250 [Ignavibacteriales bacterium]
MQAYINLQDSRFNYSYKGFCSLVCAVIDIALENYRVNDNLNCFVSDGQILKLFDNICDVSEIQYDASSWWLDRFFSGQLHDLEYNAHTIANLDNLKLKKKVLDSILKIKPEKNIQFNQKYLNLGITSETLAVQIRGTDKKNEIPEPNIDVIISKIDSYFNSGKVKNIFLSTDDKKYLDLILEKYQELVVYDDKINVSSNGIPLHSLPERDIINEEVLSSVYLLSRCGHFLYSFSNVSLLALILGVNNFKSIINLNI